MFDLDIDSNITHFISTTIIILLIIVLFTKIFNNKKENISDKQTKTKNKSSKLKRKVNLNLELNELSDQTECNSYSSSGYIEDSEDMDQIRLNERELVKNPDTFCPTNEFENNNDRLIRDVVIGRKYQQGDKQHQFDRDEVDEYFNQYQDFGNKINFSSQNRYDPVAKLAETRASNTEINQNKGLTIAEIFDGYTTDKYPGMQQCRSPDCIKPENHLDIDRKKLGWNQACTPSYSEYDIDPNREKFLSGLDAHEEPALLSPVLNN